MDRRHGKRSLPPEASEEKEIKAYSDDQQQWTQHDQDMSAMVSALSQVIGTRDSNPSATRMVQSADSSSALSESSQLPPQDQGTTSLASRFMLNGLILKGFVLSPDLSLSQASFSSLPFCGSVDHFSFLGKKIKIEISAFYIYIYIYIYIYKL